MPKVLIYILFIHFFSGFSGLNSLQSDEDQEKVLEKKDIIIYQLSGEKGKNHFKAVYFVDVNDGDFVRMILNPENHKHWLSNIKEAVNISEENDSVIYTRIVISMSVIFKKEAIVKTSVEQNSKSNITRIVQEVDHSTSTELKYKSFNDFKANWEIRKISDSKIEVKVSFLGVEDDKYPQFINSFLKSIFIKKLFKLAYRSRDQANKKEY